MILSAESLSRFQSCPRRYALEREYRVPKWRPKALLDTILRQAILALSNGGDVSTITDEATASYLEAAARPGIDSLSDPYTLARDHCAILSTVLEALSRVALLAIAPPEMIGEWQLSAFVDESGLLHRWVTVDKWDDDAKFREWHSWATYGDCCAAEVGMALHVIEIGQQRRGHQQTPWARAYKHPAIQNRYRFQKVEGGALQGDWKPVWFQDSDKNTAKAWVSLMEQDNVNLIHHLNIREPKPEDVEQFHREIASEAASMARVAEWRAETMRRVSCDLPYPCPWQPACYGAAADLESLGFVRISPQKNSRPVAAE